MSLNYPNRNHWLAVRSTPRNLRCERFTHVSTRINFLMPKLSGAGVTYNIGRNKAKRAARA